MKAVKGCHGFTPYNVTMVVFYIRLIQHTEKLLEEKQEKLCIQVLETLKKMMKLENDYGEKVRDMV